MISKFFAITVTSMTILCGTMVMPIGAVQPIATNSTVEHHSNVNSDPIKQITAQIYRVRDERPPQQNRAGSSGQSSKSGESKKQLFDQLQQQLTAKDEEIAALHEKAFVANELLTVEKRHVGSLEAQLIQKERELTALRDQGSSASMAPKDQDATKPTTQPAKHKTDDPERQLLATNLDTAKRRIGELILQLYAKESEIAGLRSTAFDSTKQLRAELDAQTEELHQAKHRIADLEQQPPLGKMPELAQAKRRIADLELQTMGKEQELALTKRRMIELEQQTITLKTQELAQAKRRVADLELQATGREQDLAQTKRRVAEIEQQAAGKEQELAKLKDDFKQVSQKLDELNPQLIARTAELAQTKQLLADLERNSFKLVDPTTTPVPDTDPANLRVAETDLPLPTTPTTSSTGTAEADSMASDLGKLNERLARLLQPELTKGMVALRRRGNKLTLVFPANALFSPGEATMTLGGSSLLERVGSVLRGFRYQTIEVATQSDNQQTQAAPGKGAQDNTNLSTIRAERTSQALINGGVESDRVKTVGNPATKPTTPTELDKGRSKSQKVEIVIMSESEPVAAPSATPSRASKKPQALSTEKVVNR